MQLAAVPSVALAVSVTRKPKTLLVSIAGDLDAHTAPRLRELLVNLARTGETDVTLDLAGLKFMDSCGLGVILGAHKQLVLAGGPGLSIVGPTRPIRKVLDLTGLSEQIEVRPSDVA